MDFENFWRKNEWCTGGAYYVNSEHSENLKFEPACYIQRYATVEALLREELRGKSGKKVVEFGCAELRFFRELKRLNAIEHVIEVDIDEDLLQNCFYHTKPELEDYIRQRSTPLTVQVMAGSIDEYDTCLEGADVVVAIELIEHLHQPVLDNVPRSIFESIRPELAIITTPNADFNEAIPNFPGRRHDDHKFEWSRKEFAEWAFGVTKQYSDYSVLFYGIGQGPPGTEHLGCCSQMAIFRLKPDADPKPKTEPQTNYKLIKEYEYPVDKTTPEERIIGEVNSRLYYIATSYDSESTEIPLEIFLPRLEGICQNVNTLRQILEKSGRTIRGTDANPVLVIDNNQTSEEEEETEQDSEEPNETNWSCYQPCDDENWDE